MSKRPNIVFFFTDDQRFDTIYALGNKQVKTPNIDKIVKKGVSFTQGHIPCGTSAAVCMPSRAMLHTGRTLFHIQGEGQEIPKDHVLLGEKLQDLGYRTFGTGKWHNGTSAYARSFTDGGEIFFGGMWDHWNVPAYHFDPTGQYDKTRKVCMNPSISNQVHVNNMDHMEIGKHSTDLFGDISVDFLKDYDDEKPLFMYLSFMAPHDPRSMPEEFMEMYNIDDIEIPENFREQHDFDFGILDCRDEILAPYPRTIEDTKKQIAEYYAMITHVDYQIGRVIDALEEKGELDNTIIIFAGDNGLAMGQHGLFGKQNHYEHSIRVPMVFAGPGLPQNEIRDSYAYLLDIYPTLCDILDTDIPTSVEGKSLLPTIRDKQVKAREDLYFAYIDTMRSVKNDQYKLIEYRTEELKKTQLFDLKSDPKEINDLFGKEGYEQIINELKELMFAYRDEWNDTDHRLGKVFWDRY